MFRSHFLRVCELPVNLSIVRGSNLKLTMKRSLTLKRFLRKLTGNLLWFNDYLIALFVYPPFAVRFP